MGNFRGLLFLLTGFLVVLLCSGCGEKPAETQPTAPVGNLTLKDLDSVDFSEFTDNPEEPEKTGAGTAAAWSPKGNYTYVLQGPVGSGGYQSALIRVDSVDFQDGSARVSYVFGKGDGTTENSDGLISCRMEVTDHEEGTREIRIRIRDNMTLEFKGTQNSRTAALIYDDVRYGLKKEG